MWRLLMDQPQQSYTDLWLVKIEISIEVKIVDAKEYEPNMLHT